MKKYVKSPITNQYLTKGKLYQVLGARSDLSFKITCDTGDVIYCLYEYCSHINFKNWIKIL